MSKFAWSSTIVLVVAALGTASSGCTVTITSDDGGGVGPGGDDEDAAEPDASGDDAGQTADTGATPDAASTCSIGVSTGSAACDDCIESSCCDAVVACDSEPLTNASDTDCEEIDSCYGDCLSPPADSGVAPGSPSDCAMLCATGHTTQGNSDFTALQSCTSTSCGTPCQ